MRQPHPELNFELGRGFVRLQRKAHSAQSLIETFRFLGMTDEEIKVKMLEVKQAQEAQRSDRV